METRRMSRRRWWVKETWIAREKPERKELGECERARNREREWEDEKGRKSGGTIKMSKKERTNVINTMHHIPATGYRRTLAGLFIARKINHGEILGSWWLFAAHFTLIKLRYILARAETFDSKVASSCRVCLCVVCFRQALTSVTLWWWGERKERRADAETFS